jgi:hypothetical protein
MQPHLREEEQFVIHDAPKVTKIDNASITDLEDGGAVIVYDGPTPINHDSPFYENLAAKNRIPQQVLDRLGSHLCDAIDDDMGSREEWENAVNEAIDQLGIKTEENITFPFNNASGVYSPAFMQALLQVSSRIERELLPIEGPAKIKNEGDADDELIDRSQRVQDFINFYLTQVVKGFYPEMRQAITWLALQGNAFTKSFFDSSSGRIEVQHVKPQDLVVNDGESSLAKCSRITHVLHLSAREMKQRQYAGLYNDTKVSPDYDDTNYSSIDEKVADTEGVTPGDDDYNEFYTLYECHVDLNLEGFEHLDDDGENTGIPLPYIITINADTKKVLSIYRNWAEGDKNCNRIEYFTHYRLKQGLGFYGWGLAHIIGGAAQAATSISRQLIDAGILSNFPGGFRAKGVNMEGNTFRVGPGEYPELEVSGMNSIQDAIMPLPFKGPDQSLKDMKDGIEKGMGDTIAAAQSQFGDINPNAPVGTTIAYLEERNTVQSTIMAGLYGSMDEMLQIIYRLFSEYFHELKYPYPVQGHKHKILGTDFKEDLRVLPVADPNVSSASLRLIKNEKVLQIAEQHPDLFNMKALIKSICKDMKIQNIDEFLVPDDEEPMPLDPVSENSNALKGEPLKAFMIQDHDSHIQTHLPIRIDPNTPPEVAQAMQAHIQEHTAMKYTIMMQQMMKKELPEDPSQLSPKEQNKIAVASAKASQQLMEMIQQQLNAQQPQVDAATIEAQAMMVEAQAKDKEVDLNAQVNMQKLENERMRLALEQMKLDQKTDMDSLKLEIERLKIVQTGKNEEQKAETSAFEAQLRYETEQDKIELQKEELSQKSLQEQHTL